VTLVERFNSSEDLLTARDALRDLTGMVDPARVDAVATNVSIAGTR
jgi:hypothetical protein